MTTKINAHHFQAAGTIYQALLASDSNKLPHHPEHAYRAFEIAKELFKACKDDAVLANVAARVMCGFLGNSQSAHCTPKELVQLAIFGCQHLIAAFGAGSNGAPAAASPPPAPAPVAPPMAPPPVAIQPPAFLAAAGNPTHPVPAPPPQYPQMPPPAAYGVPGAAPTGPIEQAPPPPPFVPQAVPAPTQVGTGFEPTIDVPDFT